MNKGGSRQPFLFVGNHLCLDFINTQMIVRGHPTDLLSGFEDLIAWLVRAKILTKGQVEGIRTTGDHTEQQHLLEQAKAFRKTLREMVERIVARKPISDSAVMAINRLLSQRPGYSQLVRTKGKVARYFHSTVVQKDSLLTPLAEAAGDLLCSGNPSLVKKCRNTACILFFYDTTKNHARNWCSMQLCGNRMKVAAHYRNKRKLRNA